ncbi:polysaccharide pyruvyl transferase family protein [Novosphingobium beihaiensis]|uniref:Polysaccharide pyruvyl transferase family protein n=1 Tax=Novosphingobium beihaiensis TaxID=2930389 RepID=A0ABT0BUG7_9SPHN|nr:polysaccharide pyruvyl transferase family protein [Novosphingobium beihaiensis]MCJ2188476.1 polysaccharide pyruvyl transferase family protein [Novosphingobium beihaiensis]
MSGTITDLQALMLSADPEADLRAAYRTRFAAARAEPRLARPPGPLRVLLAGYSGACNTGADLRTGEIIRQLRDAFGSGGIALGIITVGDHPLPDWGTVTTERIEGFPPDAVRDLCARYDAVVVCEGSLFTSTFSDGLATMLTAFLGMAAAMGKPAIAYGAEADRMSPAVEQFVAETAREALVIARNRASLERLEALGLQAELGTDTGWSFADAGMAAAQALLRERGWDGHAPLTVVCPTDPFRWPLIADPERAMFASLTGDVAPEHHSGMMFFQPAETSQDLCSAFLDGIATALHEHDRRSAEPRFTIVVGMEANDQDACLELAQRLGAPAPVVAGTTGPHAIVGILRSASLLVSARYHAVLLSMAAAVPAIGLAYDQRVRALFAEAGHPGLALEARAPGLAERLSAGLRLLAAEPDAGADFAAFAAAQRAVQRAAGERVAAYLRGSAD